MYEVCGVYVQLRYIIPRRYRPDLEDPRPCVTFTPGSFVRLEPVVSGRIDKAQLTWAITPRLQPQTGLVFNRLTGKLYVSFINDPLFSSSFFFSFNKYIYIYI